MFAGGTRPERKHRLPPEDHVEAGMRGVVPGAGLTGTAGSMCGQTASMAG